MSLRLIIASLALSGLLLPAARAGNELARALVRTESWEEIWPDAQGQPHARKVTGEIWTAALQAALNTDHAVRLPARAEAYYLDGPLILRSGDRFIADPQAEIRLKPGTNTCLIRNASIVDSAVGPVRKSLVPDHDIHIEGGIWSTLANGVREANGNRRGCSSRQDPVHGTHGVILLQNVQHVSVRNVTVRASKPFALHLANVRDFEVDGVALEHQERDGVHVNGPASHGVIRNVHGDSHDDTVALNAWEWENYAPSYGPIDHVTIENIQGTSIPRSTDSIRLLPGVKRFADGTTLECPISDIDLHDLTDLREFKFYDQPNLELGRDRDFSVRLGKLSRIRLERLRFNRPGTIHIAAEVDGITIEDVNLKFPAAGDIKLVRIGPMSETYRRAADPSTWVEIFSPDRDVTVRDFRLSKVQQNGRTLTDKQAAELVEIRNQAINVDYPQSMPRGGTGKAILIP